MNTRAATLIADTDPAHAARLLDAACDLNPYDEELARTAMRAYGRLGNDAAVKARMRQLSAALDEIDEAPDPQTEALVRSLLTPRVPSRPQIRNPRSSPP